ncbi:hypothetical protein FFI94_003075 [Rhodococcus sp. KBS0724]|uniref:hypothetical protein n=1 Tax=Rhodococcus sp. KBS0724 TaxID=1179674 RepID=UPI00110E18EC|nr:hypothetical protein [Rhodococcus sp. KBS0724]TSD45235.1 hypothetical protein FFI94_003075 [Rhodococcus sp. KBS0724]
MNRPGDLLLSPWALVSVAIILINDHVLKDAFGNTLTGKLSDIAGVFLFPLLLLSVLEVLRRSLVGRAAIAWSIAVTGIGFAAVKMVAPVGDAYEWVIGFLRWAAGGFRGDILPILVFRDPSDLWVLPILFASYLVITHNRTRAPEGAPEHEKISPALHPR